jgi:adenine-specific DNA glycosylase
MIFRTGSVLIVGMCEEAVLNVIYDFLTALLKTEFPKICQNVFGIKHTMLKDKKKKIRKKTINITVLPDNDVTKYKNNIIETGHVIFQDTKEISKKMMPTNDKIINNDDEFVIELNKTKKQRKPRTTKTHTK